MLYLYVAEVSALWDISERSIRNYYARDACQVPFSWARRGVSMPTPKTQAIER